jgi:hypothetical protein
MVRNWTIRQGQRQFVFGYGSLVAGPGPRPRRAVGAGGFIADLPGFLRGWGVAMDNRRDLPGYKCYTDSAGARPEVFVAFLDVFAIDAGHESGAAGALVAAGAVGAVNGLCLPVDESDLARLDRRERNYERLDVTDLIDAGGGRVWTYVGTVSGRAGMDEGRRAGTVVIDANYLAAVRAGFAALGEAEYRACAPSLDPGAIPVVELHRHELSPE